MIAFRRAAALLAVLLLAAPAAPAARAAGPDCANPASATQRGICASPALRRDDTEMNRLYGVLRAAVPRPLGATLRAGQRAWVAARDRDCAAPACLAERTAARLAVFTALAARVSDDNPTLPDLTAVWLAGAWKVATPSPAGREPASDLPQPGSVLSFSPGTICSGAACAQFGLEPQRLADGPGRAVLPRLLGLPADAPFYLVMLDGKAAYGLVPAPGGELLAVSPGCTAAGGDCGYVRQAWTPASPDAALHRQSAAR